MSQREENPGFLFKLYLLLALMFLGMAIGDVVTELKTLNQTLQKIQQTHPGP